VENIHKRVAAMRDRIYSVFCLWPHSLQV
jgi:hypothetical protein